MRQTDEEGGFTLIELLVVILIIAILAAIAIPVFLKQREKSYVSQMESSLKDAATAAETFSTANGGDFIGLDGADSQANNAGYTALTGEGFKRIQGVRLQLATTPDGLEYCITATHSNLPAGHAWKVATYNSSDGSPTPSDIDSC